MQILYAIAAWLFGEVKRFVGAFKQVIDMFFLAGGAGADTNANARLNFMAAFFNFEQVDLAQQAFANNSRAHFTGFAQQHHKLFATADQWSQTRMALT